MSRLLALISCMLCVSSGFTQGTPINHAKVVVGFHVKIKAAASYAVSLGGFGADPIVYSNTTFTNQAGLSTLVSTPDIAGLAVPGTVYRLIISCTSWKWADIQFNAPPGHTAMIGLAGQARVPRSTFRTADLNGASGTAQIDVSFEPNDGSSALRPGYASAPTIGNVLWSIGVGTTRYGTSAGTIRWRQPGVTYDLLDAASLVFADPYDPNGDVVVTRDSQYRIASISTWAVQVVVRPGGTPNSGYTIECYEPGATLTAHTGFREYVISNPDSSWNNRVKIDITTRSPGVTNAVDSWTLSQQGTIAQLEQGGGGRRLRLISRSGPGTDERSEIATGDAGPSTTVISRTRRLYKVLFKSTPLEREELMYEVADPIAYFDDSGTDQTNSTGLDLTTTYVYYEDSSKTGSFGKLKSVTRSDGSWQAFRYYGDAVSDAADAAKWGQLAAAYSPWLDNAGVSAATATDMNCAAQLFDYVGDRDIYKELISRQERKLLNTTTALTTTTYATGTSTIVFGSQPLRITTSTVYSDATHSTATVTKTFAPDATNGMAGRLCSQVNPDGTAISMAYMTNLAYYGFTTETVFTGTASAVAGSTLYTNISGLLVEPIWISPTKSTSKQTARDATGRTMSESSGVNFDPANLLSGFTVAAKAYIYSTKGELLQTDSLNSARQVYTWSNGQLTTQTDLNQLPSQNTYDAYGRLLQQTYAGASNNPVSNTIVVDYTYDAAGRLTSTKRSDGGLELQTTTVFNLAGLPISSTDEKGLVTTMTYTDGSRTITATLPGGATKIESRYVDGSSKLSSGSGMVPAFRTVTVNTDGTQTTAVYTLRASDLTAVQGASSSTLATVLAAIPRWASTKVDWQGRKVLEQKPATGGPFAKQYFYNTVGQLVKTTESGLAATLYTYNAFGEPDMTGLDVDGDGALVPASSDRIQKVETSYHASSHGAGTGTINKETLTYAYNQTGSATPYLMSDIQQELMPVGLGNPNAINLFSLPSGWIPGNTIRTLSQDLFGNVTITSKMASYGSVQGTVTTAVPASSTPEITTSLYSQVRSKQSAQGLTTLYRYDPLARLTEVIDPRYGSTHPLKTAYFTTNSAAAGTYAIATTATGANGQVAWTEDAAGNRTTYAYSTTDGRAVTETNALGKAIYTAYNTRGQVIRQWGPATYPVEYEYNDYGERIKQRTFRDTTTDYTAAAWGTGTYPSTTGDVTTWAYDAGTGLLLSKTDAASQTVSYTYDIRGQLATRTWARGVVTTYTYSPVTGEQTAISYSDGTPGLVYTYNRLGQNISVVQGTGTGTLTTLLARCVCGKVTRETFDPTFFGNQVLTYKIDSTGAGTKGRTVGYQLGVGESYALNGDYTYGYDTYGRFSTLDVANEGITYTYGYLANSNLISTLNEDAYTQSFTYETYRDHVTRIETIGVDRVLAGVSYVVDALGRRSSAVHDGDLFARYSGGGTHTLYGYNDRSEVTSAQSWTGLDLNDTSSGSVLGGRKFDFTFDPIGNRTNSKVDNRQTDYTANALNQYSSRAAPRVIDVNGLASGSGTVTVTGSATSSTSSPGPGTVTASSVGRVGNYYAATLTNTGGDTGPRWFTANISATYGGSQIRNAWLPPATEAYAYDLDGNLTSDGRWTYTWDAENRLISMETVTVAYQAGAPRQFISFKYDYQGRRIRKTVANWSGTAYVAAVDRKFIYNGWNLIAEYDALTTLTLARTYVWGLDISRTLEDAGGVHGLLMIRDWATGGAHQTIYDGNGNLLGLVERRTGEITAQYEYTPFGETLRATGSYAASNPFRFSTKYADIETGLVYYGRRYYSPSQGRFLGRDPIQEKGGLNLYGFCRNNSVNLWDVNGEEPSEDPEYYGQTTTVWEKVDGEGRWVTYRATLAQGAIEGFDPLVWVSDDSGGSTSLRPGPSSPADAHMGQGDGQGISVIFAAATVNPATPVTPPPRVLAVGKSRKFTEAEIALTKSIFGTTIDTSKPEIFLKKAYFFQPKDTTITPNGNMYWSPDGTGYRDDFAKDPDVLERGWFVHELVHIWQYQHGVNVRLRGIEAAGKYEYLPLQAGKKFEDYNIEQQGDIVRDYYYLTQGFKTPGSATIGDYQALIPFLPKP